MYHDVTLNLETKKDIIEIEWIVLNNPVLKYTSYYIDSTKYLILLLLYFRNREVTRLFIRLHCNNSIITN